MSVLFLVLFVTAGVYKGTPILQTLEVPDLTVVFAGLTLAACIYVVPGRESPPRFVSFAPMVIFFGLMLLGIPRSDTRVGLDQWTQFFTLTLLAAVAPLFLLRNDRLIHNFFWCVSFLGIYFAASVLVQQSSGRFVVISTNTIQTARFIGGALIWLSILGVRRKIGLLLAFILGAPMAYAVVGAGSRGPLLAIIVSIVIALQYGGRGSGVERGGLAKRLGLPLVLGFLLFIGYINAPLASHDRLLTIGESGGVRLLAWRVTLENIVHNPLGVGWGNWQQFVDNAGAGNQLFGLGHPHNVVLLIFLEGGWLAGAGIVWLFLRCGASAFRNGATPAGQAVLALFVFFLFNSLVSDNLNDARITFTMSGIILAREALINTGRESSVADYA